MDNGEALIFILDIGTRSVTGIAGRQAGDLFEVAAWHTLPHPRRAMIDGQIEDIGQVAQVARQVKEHLEGRVGTRFGRVSVAAAGRALRTRHASAEMRPTPGIPITAQSAYMLENEAIAAARAELDNSDDSTPYFCAGHSVVRYTLDGYPFASIVGHRAAHAQVELIATFLPAEVVESLRSCMSQVGLEIDTLTLEPIAAMRAVIPQDLRLLNLALVDIGAGTSDIALSAGGAVAGYTMATVAGDEVTETLIKRYLVDFDTAERLKLSADGDGDLEYTDILGFARRVPCAEVRETMRPAVQTLAEVVAAKIQEANGGPPAAVFLVGGGSKAPGIAALLAESLGLAPDRVALAGTAFSQRVLSGDTGLDGPEFATPVGISLIAAENAGTEGASVFINGQRVRLFALGRASLLEALLAAGYRYSDLMGRNGRSLTFTLNGVKTIVRGEPYTTAELTVNGKPASLATMLEDGDTIEMVKATNGRDAEARILNYSQGALPLTVRLNGHPLLAGLVARVNGTTAPPDTPIFEQDTVEVYVVRTAAQLCAAAGLDTSSGLKVNGGKAAPEYELRDGDQLECASGQIPPAQPPAVPEAALLAEPATPAPAAAAPAPSPLPALPPAMALQPDEAPAHSAHAAPPKAKPAAKAANRAVDPRTPPPAALPADSTPEAETPPTERDAHAPARSLRIELNGRTVVLPPKPGGDAYRLYDMMPLVDIDPANPQGWVQVRVNGQDAPYLHKLSAGDVVTIGWEAK